MSGAWHDVIALAELPERQGRLVRIEGEGVALFRDGERLFAIDDLCPHQGASLAEGTFHDGRVICPWHNWVFEASTGKCPRETHEPVRAHEVRVRDGRVEVQLGE